MLLWKTHSSNNGRRADAPLPKALSIWWIHFGCMDQWIHPKSPWYNTVQCLLGHHQGVFNKSLINETQNPQTVNENMQPYMNHIDSTIKPMTGKTCQWEVDRLRKWFMYGYTFDSLFVDSWFCLINFHLRCAGDTLYCFRLLLCCYVNIENFSKLTLKKCPLQFDWMTWTRQSIPLEHCKTPKPIFFSSNIKR